MERPTEEGPQTLPRLQASGQGASRTGAESLHLAEYGSCQVVVLSELFSLALNGDVGAGAIEGIDGEFAQGGEIVWPVIPAVSGVVLVEGDVERPMQAILRARPILATNDSEETVVKPQNAIMSWWELVNRLGSRSRRSCPEGRVVDLIEGFDCVVVDDHDVVTADTTGYRASPRVSPQIVIRRMPVSKIDAVNRIQHIRKFYQADGRKPFSSLAIHPSTCAAQNLCCFLDRRNPLGESSAISVAAARRQVRQSVMIVLGELE